MTQTHSPAQLTTTLASISVRGPAESGSGWFGVSNPAPGRDRPLLDAVLGLQEERGEEKGDEGKEGGKRGGG